MAITDHGAARARDLRDLKMLAKESLVGLALRRGDKSLAVAVCTSILPVICMGEMFDFTSSHHHSHLRAEISAVLSPDLSPDHGRHGWHVKGSIPSRPSSTCLRPAAVQGSALTSALTSDLSPDLI